jgi:hypothetical protein
VGVGGAIGCLATGTNTSACAEAPAGVPPRCRRGSPSCSPRRRDRRSVSPSPAHAGDRRRRYFLAALRDELAEVASAPAPAPGRPGARNDTLNRAAFRLAQLAVDGAGTLDELEHYLLDAALAAGLDELEARATIASGLRAGQQHPRR